MGYTPAFGVLLLVSLLSGSLSVGGPPQSREWKAKYKIGTGLEGVIQEDTKLRVKLDEQTIVCRAKKGAGLAIPSRAVIEISYDNVALRRLSTSDMTEAMLDLWIRRHPLEALTMPFIWAGSSFFKEKDHFVNVVWKDDGVLKEVVLELGKRDYHAFLDRLQTVTSQRWEHLPDTRKKLREELEARKDERMPWELDRRVAFGELILKPGLYQLVYLPDQDDTGHLYFFRGKKVKTDKVQLVVPVEIFPREGDSTSSEIIYSGPGGEFTSGISELKMGNRIFRISGTDRQNRTGR